MKKNVRNNVCVTVALVCLALVVLFAWLGCGKQHGAAGPVHGGRRRVRGGRQLSDQWPSRRDGAEGGRGRRQVTNFLSPIQPSGARPAPCPSGAFQAGEQRINGRDTK